MRRDCWAVHRPPVKIPQFSMLKVLVKRESRYPASRKAIRYALQKVLREEGLDRLDVEVSVFVCGSRKMKSMAKKHLGDDKLHEVLSFGQSIVKPLSEQRGFVNQPDTIMRLGDIIVCWPEVVRLAAVNNKMVDEQLAFLVGHGMEHLLGKHHE